MFLLAFWQGFQLLILSLFYYFIFLLKDGSSFLYRLFHYKQNKMLILIKKRKGGNIYTATTNHLCYPGTTIQKTLAIQRFLLEHERELLVIVEMMEMRYNIFIQTIYFNGGKQSEEKNISRRKTNNYLVKGERKGKEK